MEPGANNPMWYGTEMAFLVVLCLLPYFKVSPLGSDTQPYALLAMLLAILVESYKTKTIPFRPSTAMLSSFLFVFGLPSGEFSATISLAIVPIAIDYLSRINPKALSRGVRVSILIMLGGVALNFVAEGVTSSLISNFRSSPLRGMNSFASEPSFLGLMGFAAAIISRKIGLSWNWLILSGLVVLASGSATAILPFTIYIFLVFVKGWKLLLLPLLMVAFVSGMQFASTTDTRLGGLVKLSLQSPELILMDQSVANRVIRTAGPLMTAYQNGFVPHGLKANINIEIPGIAATADTELNRLGNLGSFLGFGLGFMSLPVIVWYLMRSKTSMDVWFALLFFSLTNLSIATPYLWIVFSLPWMEYRHRRNTTLLKKFPRATLPRYGKLSANTPCAYP